MSLSDALLLDPYPFETWIAKRPEKGTGTLNDPYGADNQVQFDQLMTELGTIAGPRLIHLGPGTFETAGYADGVSGGWQIKALWRIVGSGKDVTTLKLVNANTANTQFYAIGHALTSGSPAAPNLVDFSEILDLTVDCALATQPGSSVACGAIRLMGNHVRIERVKAIQWGTKLRLSHVSLSLS